MAVRIQSVPASVTFPLRQRVLRPHQQIDELALSGDDDPSSGHFAAFDDRGDIVGTGSVWREPAPWPSDVDQTWRLRGMATAEDRRGQGVGRAVLAAVVAHVAAAGGGLLWCTARVSAATFYDTAGFATRGQPWDEPIIGPHVVMFRTVDAGPEAVTARS